MQAKERSDTSIAGPPKPLLLVDVDGVLSLFGPGGAEHTAADRAARVEGSFHSIDGMLHFLSRTAAAHLLGLADAYELVWATGWEEKANEYLPHLLDLPAALPFIPFSAADAEARSTRAHWKLTAIDAYAGERALAWIDDTFNAACHEWAEARPAPTLLVATAPEVGLTATEATLLSSWAESLARA